MNKIILHVSGHLDITPLEFNKNYIPILRFFGDEGNAFVVGDCIGADTLAQQLFHNHGYKNVTVYHLSEKPRYNVGNFNTVGGFLTDNARDTAMTEASHMDIAWIRKGKERSGTARNLIRRWQQIHKQLIEYRNNIMSRHESNQHAASKIWESLKWRLDEKEMAEVEDYFNHYILNQTSRESFGEYLKSVELKYSHYHNILAYYQ